MAKTALIQKQQRKPKFSSRGYNRCKRCGRPRAYYRKFGLCRICLRELAHAGELPGISKPGLRVYAKRDSLPRVLGGLGIAIISTSKGLVTDKQAQKDRTGGEVLCFVW